MRQSTFVLCLLAALSGYGCTGGGGGGDGGDGGDGDGGDDGGGDDAPPFTNGVSTLSGHAMAGYVDGARGKARFSNPVNVAFGPDGMLYVADFDNGKIRIVDPEDGQTATTIAAMGFQRPFAMTFAPDGTLYVSTDHDPNGSHSLMSGTIWRVDVESKAATPIALRIGRPRGLAWINGQLAVSDYAHHVIQLVDPASGAVTPLVGAWDAAGMIDAVGGAARFSTPYGLAVSEGRLVVADFDNHRVRLVGLDGQVSTYAGIGAAGFGDGSLASAKFNKPQGVAVAANGDIYITDLQNFRVRRLRGSAVETIAGSGTGGYLDSDDKLAGQFFGLEGLSVEPDGSTVFVADGGRGENVPYNRIRTIKMD